MPLVGYVTARFMGRGYEYEELYQYGCIGLIKAVDRFDPDYGVAFSTYAVPLIIGEIKRFLRSVPRSCVLLARKKIQEKQTSTNVQNLCQSVRKRESSLIWSALCRA